MHSLHSFPPQSSIQLSFPQHEISQLPSKGAIPISGVFYPFLCFFFPCSSCHNLGPWLFFIMVYFLNPPRALGLFLTCSIIVLVPGSYADVHILNETGSLGYWNLWNFRYWQELCLKQRSRQTSVQAKQIISLRVMLFASCCLGPGGGPAATVEAGRHEFGFWLGQLLIVQYFSSLGLKSVFWNSCLIVYPFLPFLPILLWQRSEADDT